MRKFGLVLIVMFVALLAGCAVMDTIMGVQRDDKGDITGEAPVAPISFLGTIVPGLAGIAGAARWAYTEVNKRKIDKNFKAVVAGVTEAVDKKVVDKNVLYPVLTAASELYTQRDFFVKCVDKAKDEVRKVRAEKPPV
jgi:hypothetical protein